MYSILFVCTGNICRSPTAEAVFWHIVRARDLGAHFHIDSAGTQAYHVGEPPDYRSIEAALEQGVMMEGQQARKVSARDFDEFTHILALDRGHYVELGRMAPSSARAALALLLDYHEDYKGQDVPDPYYGGKEDFEHTYQLIEKGVGALLDQLAEELGV